jgi:hypothetical protein
VQLGTKMKEIQKKVAIDQENKKTKKSRTKVEKQETWRIT